MRILIIPELDLHPTSERTPQIYRRLANTHRLVGLRGRWDKTFQDLDKPAIVRILPYVLNQLDLAQKGVRVGHAQRVDLILCETPHHALAGLFIGKVLNRPCVWDSHGNVVLYSRSVGKGRVFTAVSAWMERMMGRSLDVLFAVSQLDADAYVQMGIPPERIRILPAAVDVDEIERRTADRRREKISRSRRSNEPPILLFFGSFQYGPNRHALRYVNEVLAPGLARAGLACAIQVAGRDIPAWDYHPSIRILGFVDDLHRYIADADLGIVPVWMGVGVLYKALDIMAVGTPMVATQFVARGIPELRDHVHALLADTPESFVDLVLQAAKRPDDLQEMGRRGKELVSQYYNWKAHWGPFESTLSSTIESRRGRDAGHGH